MLRQKHGFFRSVLVAADTVVIASAAVLAYFVRFGLLAGTAPPPEGEVVSYVTHAIPIQTSVPIMLLTILGIGLYRPRRDQSFFPEAWDIIKSVSIGTALTFAAISFFSRALFDGRDPSRLQYVVYAGLCLVMLTTWRLGFRVVLRAVRRHGWNLRHVAIIGTGRLGHVVCRTLRRNSWTGITPGFFVSHHPHTARAHCLDLPVRGGLQELESILEKTDLSGVFIALPARMIALVPELLMRLERYPVDVRVVPDMNPKYMPLNMAVNELDGMPILSVRESPLNGWGGVLKRAIDVLGSAVGLIVFAIPMSLIALGVRLSGPGPIIFRQDRMSLNGQHFKIFKFRTMSQADAEVLELEDAKLGTEAWTKRGDPRITAVGRFLRSTSLDELPQLLNVLLGEMSLVGPRPERPELIQSFREDWRGYMLRQNIKAGMTGWAQVNGLRGDTSLRKRVQYDLFYVRNWSLGFDLRILWMTLFRGFAHANAK